MTNTVFSGGALDVFFTPSLAPAAWTNLVRAGVDTATNGLDVAVPRSLLPPAPEPGPVTAVTNIVPSSYDPDILITNIVVTSPPVPGEAGFFRLADLADTDSDGLTDAYENWASRTGPLDPDSDNDGLTDGEEAALGTGPLSADTDGDGLSDGWEAAHGFNPLAVQADGTHGAGDDPDGDGLPNLLESHSGTSPFETDTDGDGLSDGEEVDLRATYPNLNPLLWDSDGDMLPDGWEVQYGLSPCECVLTNSPGWDADGDGLGLFDEYRYCTSPATNDTDGDLAQDGAEVPHSAGSCPNDAGDNGDPANCVTLRLTVGDSSGSNSERWNLEVCEEATGKAVARHCD